MVQVKKINTKNRSYYFCDDMINIKNLHSNLLTIDKKPHKEFDIYNIGYITIKKNWWLWKYLRCKSIIFNNSFCYGTFLKKKNSEEYLIIDSTDKYEEVWSGIRSEIETINGRKEMFYEKNYARIGINTVDNLPLNKPLKFSTLTIIIRRVFQEGEKLYPQIYLDKCLYELRV